MAKSLDFHLFCLYTFGHFSMFFRYHFVHINYHLYISVFLFHQGNPPLPMPPPNNKLVNQEFGKFLVCYFISSLFSCMSFMFELTRMTFCLFVIFLLFYFYLFVFLATAKLALVIANQKYQFPRNESEILVHPIDDAKLLSATLEKIGFKVTCLVNLTKKEMEAAIQGFCKLLECTKGVYSLFYFCGHGFEDHGKTFLVPIDATNKWTSDVALSAEYVLSEIQHCRATKLDVVLLDVCRIK